MASTRYNNNKETKVQISVYANKLKNVAGAFKGTSDPYAVVTILAGSHFEKPEVLGKTEVIKNTLNPNWVTTFETTFNFGRETRFNVGIFDYISKTDKSKSMGSATFEIGEVMGTRGNIRAKKLKGGGTVFVRVTKAAEIDYGTIKLRLRGIQLKNLEGIFSKSDPFLVIQSQSNDAGGRVWQPVYRSETVKNDLNPTWNEAEISMEKLCGGDKDHCLQIEVWDWEKSGKHRDMGKFQTTVNGLLSSVVLNGYEDEKHIDMSKAFKLVHKAKTYGYIVVVKAEIQGENLTSPQPQTAGSMMHAERISDGVMSSTPPKKFIKINGVTKINPEYKAWKIVQAASASETESASDATSNTMPSFGSALDAPNQQPAHSGDFSSALDAPSAPPQPQPSQPLPPPLAPPAPPVAAPPRPVPVPMTTTTTTTTKPTFVDYISGGTEINLTVAIDFTGSNGDPRLPGTLHHIYRDGQLNDYEKALTAVGSIVAKYDSDQMFPVYGFGAKYGGVIQHCFQIGSAPELKGVRGMLEGYRSVFKTGLTMSGPTVFAEVILAAAAQARNKQESNKRIGKQAYSILLILTDGAVTDVEQTKEAIRQASTAPLSIVIVGIGQADFSAMQFLDDFQKAEGGRTRDIVQFVEFSRHRDNKAALTRETLDEIPDQLVGYFYGNKIMPLRPTGGSSLNIFEEEHDEEEDIDLSIDIDENGDITLQQNTPGTTWDGQSYGKVSTFLPPPVAPPSGYGVPAGYGASASAPSAPPTNYGYQSAVNPGYQPAANSGYQPAAPTNAYAPYGSAPSYHNPPSNQPAPSTNAYAPYGSNSSYGNAPPNQPAASTNAYAPYGSTVPQNQPSVSNNAYAPYGGVASYGGPPSTFSSQNPTMSAPRGAYTSASQGGYAAPQNNYGAPHGSYSSSSNSGNSNGVYIPSPSPPVHTSEPKLIHIRAPEGSYPGMQLRVQNPTTGQLQIVTIPNGVQPGSQFAVQL